MTKTRTKIARPVLEDFAIEGEPLTEAQKTALRFRLETLGRRGLNVLAAHGIGIYVDDVRRSRPATIPGLIIQNAWHAGRRDARQELIRILETDSEQPVGCKVLAEDSFAVACYNANTLGDLDLSNATEADDGDCEAWGLRGNEWAYEIGRAYEALTWDTKHEDA